MGMSSLMADRAVEATVDHINFCSFLSEPPSQENVPEKKRAFRNFTAPGRRILMSAVGLPPTIETSGQNRLDHLAGDIGETVVAALEAVGEALVIDAQQVQERGMEIVHMDGVLGDAEA